MKLSDRLETLDCRKDSKARRVSNVAPDTVANVTAEQLEAGMTLEAIEGLSVPAFAYQTQITLHGKLPAFDPNARPGGYKAVFQNQNGSIGVRYSAIDAEKKKLIARAAKVSSAGWGSSTNSTGFEVSKSFRPVWEAGKEVEGSREQAKQATLTALRSVPVSRFYGTAFAGVLAYGMGYYVAAEIGAIPANEVWPLIQDLFGVQDESDLLAREAVKQAEQDASNAKWRAECDARAAEREKLAGEKQARFAAFLSTVTGERLAVIPETSGFSFLRYRSDNENPEKQGEFAPVRITLQKRGPALCYSVNGGAFKACKSRFSDKLKVWNAAANRGEVWAG